MKKIVEVAIFLFLLAVGVLLLSVALSGCSVGSSLIVSAIDDYCALPEADRLAYRSLVNSKAAPNSIIIECAGRSL